MDPATAPKKGGVGGSSMATRLLVVVGGLFVLVLIAGIAFKLLSSSGASFDKTAMLSVAQDQTEIIRLSTLGVESGVQQSVKNFSITTQLGIKSDQTKLLTYLQSRSYKVNPKALILKQNANTDLLLTNAKSSSTFDTAYKDVMAKSLEAYQRDLTRAYEGSSESAKAVLNENYDSASLLLTQLTGEVKE